MRILRLFLSATFLLGCTFGIAQRPAAVAEGGKQAQPGLSAPSPTQTTTAEKSPVPTTAKLKPAELKGLDVNLMDSSVNACEDFYQYSCGGWIKENPVPPDRSSWGRDSELADQNLVILRTILERATANNPNRSAVEQKIGDQYASCMDEPRIETLGPSPLKPHLDSIAAVQDKQQLAAELARQHNAFAPLNPYGGMAMFRFSSDQDFKDATSEIAEADQAGLGLPERDYYFRDDEKSKELRVQYVQHIANMFRLLGDSPAQAATDAQIVMRIETALAKGSLDVVARRDPTKLYHKMTVQELKALSPNFDWDTYLQGVNLPSVQSLNVAVPEFFTNLEGVLKAEPMENWQTYLRWHVTHDMAPYLSSNFVDENFDFYGRKLQGTEQLRPRWKRCVDYVDRDLGEALGQAYVKEAFPPSSKERTLKMVHDIEAAMATDIQSLDWMSPATKQRAVEKLHTVANKIGYPDKWRDYSQLEIVRGDFAGNIVRAQTFENQRQLAKIGKPLDRGEWDMSPPTVNAYYNPQMNDINFPAGILQPPFYDPRADDAVNYGDAGGVIGHELTHGFDDEGRQFDARGNLNDWWTPPDAKAFEGRTQCVVDEYNQFTATGDVKVNGKLTLGENVADIGGLRLAFMAYMTSLNGQPAPKADGMSADRRFFVSYAQGWCENQRPEALRMQAQTNPHSPAKWRVNGVVSNLPEFETAFGCKAGQAMVRAKACRVW
jgi:endothelin-converting enzyme/putative endopeptidase